MRRRLKPQANLARSADLYCRTFAGPTPVGLFLALLAVNLFVFPGRADIIPSDRLYPWQGNVGVPGGIPNRPIGKNAVTDYGADPTGVNDSAPAIQSAINNSARGTAAYLPAGTYRIVGVLNPRSNSSIRGDGMGMTILKPESDKSNGTIVNSGDWPVPSPTIPITGGATKGSSSVTVDSTTGIGVN